MTLNYFTEHLRFTICKDMLNISFIQILFGDWDTDWTEGHGWMGHGWTRIGRRDTDGWDTDGNFDNVFERKDVLVIDKGYMYLQSFSILSLFFSTVAPQDHYSLDVGNHRSTKSGLFYVLPVADVKQCRFFIANNLQQVANKNALHNIVRRK